MIKKPKAKSEIDFPSAKWVVMDGIDSAHCKLCTRWLRPKKKNIYLFV